jgi:hypothetical protein
MCSRTTPIWPGLCEGPSSLLRTPRTSGGCPRPPVLPVAMEESVAWARSEGVVSPSAVLVVVVGESAASEETVALPPAFSPTAAVVAGVGELRPAPPPWPFSGAWAPALPPGSHHHAGAFGTYSLRLDCSARVPPPEPRRPFWPGQHPHNPFPGAPAPAPSLFLSRWGPDLRDLARRDLHQCTAGGPVRRQGSGAHNWGRRPVAGPPGRPRPGSASMPGPTSAAPGPHTGLSPHSRVKGPQDA